MSSTSKNFLISGLNIGYPSGIITTVSTALVNVGKITVLDNYISTTTIINSWTPGKEFKNINRYTLGISDNNTSNRIDTVYCLPNTQQSYDNNSYALSFTVVEGTPNSNPSMSDEVPQDGIFLGCIFVPYPFDQ